MMNLTGLRCLVLGGGTVATARVEALVGVGARVKVISPAVTPRISELAEAGQLELCLRRYRRGDLRGCRLAFDATDDEKIRGQVASEASEQGVLLNVADRPALCDFIMPAILRRGELTVAVSTGGCSPALAAKIRRQLERRLGSEYAMAVDVLGRVRGFLSRLPRDERKRRLCQLANSALPALLRQGDMAAVDRLLAEAVAEDCNLARLGIVTGG